MKKSQLPSILFFLATTTILFLGFYRNQWNIVLPGKFRVFQHDDQSLVMSRLTETRKNGIFSQGGLLGRGDPEKFGIETENADYEGWYTYQYDMYLKDQTFQTYNIYGSQSGAQGIFFGVLDRVSPLPPGENLRIYRILASLSFAIVLGFLVLWFFTEFGWVTAIFAFFITLTSPWFTVFGRNLFYVPAFFYIPITAATYFLARHSTRLEQSKLKFGFLVFATILLKCLFNGFDFILPSILMLGAPIIYFAIRDNWGITKFIQTGLIVSVGVIAAILFSLIILNIQLGSVLNDFSKATTYLLDTFSRRTMGNPDRFPEYAESLQANTWDVLRIYFQGDVAVAKTSLRFTDLTLTFAFFTGIFFLINRSAKKVFSNSRKSMALIIAAWSSILSPLLWFVIFKGQAYMHTRTNFLSWYMPYTIYGFALCGCVLQNLISTLRQLGAKSNPP